MGVKPNILRFAWLRERNHIVFFLGPKTDCEEHEMKADETLDCVGLYCPMPIVKTASKVREMEPGQVLEVVADDKGIKSDMPAWAE